MAPSEHRGGSDLGARVLAAIPAILFAIVIVWQGGWLFAAGLAALGAVCLHELFAMFERVTHPVAEVTGRDEGVQVRYRVVSTSVGTISDVIVNRPPLTLLMALSRNGAIFSATGENEDFCAARCTCSW